MWAARLRWGWALSARPPPRRVLRLLVEGKSDDEVKQFMYERYGDFILYEPRWTPKTWLLWLGPLVLAVMGLGIWWSMGFSRRDTRQGLTDLDRNKV